MAQKPTPEFRAEAVRVALTSGLPRKQVAADFGIGFSTLSRWIQQDRRNPEKPTVQSDLERRVASTVLTLNGLPERAFLAPARWSLNTDACSRWNFLNGFLLVLSSKRQIAANALSMDF